MNQLLRLLFVSLFVFFSGSFLHAQVNGGDNVYEFLNLSPSARITGLGGSAIAVRDRDVILAFHNPAALNPLMHSGLSFNHDFVVADIAHGNVAYGHYLKKWGVTAHASVHYIDYGDFNETDEIGDVIGSFDASETAFTIGAGKELYERLSVGVNLKAVTSQLESYNSFGILGDVAAMFHDTASNLNVTLVFKNIGRQLSTYNGENEPLPFDVQIGVSKKLKYLPFRFSVIYQNVHRWNVLFDDPDLRDEGIFVTDNQSTSDNDFFDNLFRHVVFNGEFLFGKKENFNVRFGYNHQRRKELSVRNIRSLTGFSFGFGLKINRFRLDYGQSFLHIGGRQNHIGISTNFASFKKNKKRKR